VASTSVAKNRIGVRRRQTTKRLTLDYSTTPAHLCRDKGDRIQFCRQRKRRPAKGLALLDFCRLKSLDDKSATQSDKGLPITDHRSPITHYKNRFSTSSGAAA
jgi:hypothetical protein